MNVMRFPNRRQTVPADGEDGDDFAACEFHTEEEAASCRCDGWAGAMGHSGPPPPRAPESGARPADNHPA